MKKFIPSLLFVCLTCLAFDICILSAQNHHLKDQLGAAYLRSDAAGIPPAISTDSMFKEARRAQNIAVESQKWAAESVERAKEAYELVHKYETALKMALDQRDEERQAKAIVAVNEKQGAHNFIYVEADTWVDLATGEKVPAMKKIAPVNDVSQPPVNRWQAEFPTFNHLSIDPDVSLQRPASGVFSVPMVFIDDLGTGGRNR